MVRTPRLISTLSILLLGCSSTPPRLEYGQLNSRAMGREMNYAVYEPSQRVAEDELPLIIFLHGGGDDVTSFDKAHVGQHLDQAIEEGRIPPVVVAVPEGNWGFWENWADGSRLYRDWVIQEMMPEVRTRYRTAACPEGCHVMGISMGGHGALRFAFKQPSHFSSVTAISSPIFNTQQMLDFRSSFWWGLFIPTGRIWGKVKDRSFVEKDDLFIQWSEQADLKGLDLHLAWGENDHKRVINTSQHFEQHLNQHQIAHTHEVFVGGHEWDVWVPVIERAIAVQLNVKLPRSSADLRALKHAP